MISGIQEKLQLAAVHFEAGEFERGAAGPHWLWQRSVPKSKRPDVEAELWARTSSRTYLIHISEVELHYAHGTY